MKNSILRLLAVLLAAICLFSLVACDKKVTSDESVTEKTTKPSQSTQKETGTNDDDNKDWPPEDGLVFIGTDELNPDSVYYSSIEEAIAANPDGADLKFCKNYEAEAPIVFPETGDFSLSFNSYEISCTFTSGAVAEYNKNNFQNYVYYNNLERLIETEQEYLHTYDAESGLHRNGYIWIFNATENFETGKYKVINKNVTVEDSIPELTYERVYDLDVWGLPYVAGNNGNHYYTLEEAIEKATGTSVILIHIESDYTAQNGVFEIPWSDDFKYRIPYDYHLLEGSFDHGVTYDDSANGFCYYSDLKHLCATGSLYDTYVWVWTESESLVPGKYLVTSNSGAEEHDEITGYYTTFSIGNYTLVRIADLSGFADALAGNPTEDDITENDTTENDTTENDTAEDPTEDPAEDPTENPAED